MDKNRVIAMLIVIALYFGPIGMLFFYDDVLVDSFSEMGLFLITIFGMIAAFYIGVNKPFGKTAAKKQAAANDQAARKAA